MSKYFMKNNEKSATVREVTPDYKKNASRNLAPTTTRITVSKYPFRTL